MAEYADVVKARRARMSPVGHEQAAVFTQGATIAADLLALSLASDLAEATTIGPLEVAEADTWADRARVTPQIVEAAERLQDIARTMGTILACDDPISDSALEAVMRSIAGPAG